VLQGLRQKFIAQGADAATATGRAYEALWGTINRQAAMLSYNEVFLVLALIFLAMAPLVLMMRKPKRGGAMMAH
jgi:DHA2 family multidrug resistance protein